MKHLISKILALSIVLNFICSLANCQTFYSQVNTTWSGNKLGTCNNSTTIGTDGCMMTSMAMLTANYNPATLNNWLTNNGGYSNGCLLNFGSIPPCSGVKYETTTSTTNDWTTIYSKINSGQKALVNVTFIGSKTAFNHWVLVCKFTGTSSQKAVASAYQVFDPGFSTQKALTLADYISGWRYAKYYSNYATTTASVGNITGICGTLKTTEIVSWATVANATNYEVTIRKTSQTTTNTYTTQSTSYTFNNLTLGSTYEVKVRPIFCSSYGVASTFTFSTAYKRGVVNEPIPKLNFEVTLAPNPVNTGGLIKLKLSNFEQGRYSVVIYSAMGNVISNNVANVSNQEELIQIQSPVNKGFYIVRIMSSNGVTISTSKLIVTN